MQTTLTALCLVTIKLHCGSWCPADWPLLCLLILLHAQDPNSWFHWSPICTKGILMLQIQSPSSSFWSHFQIKTWCKCISFISNLTLSSFMSTWSFDILVFPMKSWPTLWSAFARDPILDWTFLTKLSWLNFLDWTFSQWKVDQPCDRCLPGSQSLTGPSSGLVRERDPPPLCSLELKNISIIGEN